MKAVARRDLIVGGPNLAAQAFKAGLVDECHLFIWPVVLGGGKPALPTDTRAELARLISSARRRARRIAPAAPPRPRSPGRWQPL